MTLNSETFWYLIFISLTYLFLTGKVRGREILEDLLSFGVFEISYCKIAIKPKTNKISLLENFLFKFQTLGPSRLYILLLLVALFLLNLLHQLWAAPGIWLLQRDLSRGL